MLFHGTYLTVYFNNLNLSNNEQSPHCRCLRLRLSAHGWLAYASGYEPIAVETMEAAKDEVEKLLPGAVIVTAMKFIRGTAQELTSW